MAVTNYKVVIGDYYLLFENSVTEIYPTQLLWYKKYPVLLLISYQSVVLQAFTSIFAVVSTWMAPGIVRRGADSSDEGAKIQFSGYSKCQKSLKTSVFTFRRGAIALRWRHSWVSEGHSTFIF